MASHTRHQHVGKLKTTVATHTKKKSLFPDRVRAQEVLAEQ